jgi:hypothetical protein
MQWFDWYVGNLSGYYHSDFLEEVSVTWDFDNTWKLAINKVTKSLTASLSTPLSEHYHFPLGIHSFPLGEPYFKKSYTEL